MFRDKTLKNIIYLPEVQSTNSYLKEMLQSSRLPEGFVLITDNQTSGRGQYGKVWNAEDGKNLLFSAVWYPNFLKLADYFQLLMSVCLSITDVLSKVGLDAKIKWPNDIFVGGQKIAGILIEASIQGNKWDYAVVGIGLNVNQMDFGPIQGTSIALQQGRPMDRYDLFTELLQSLETNYRKLQAGWPGDILSEYNSLLFFRGKKVSFTQLKTQEKIVLQNLKADMSGDLIGVDDSGKAHRFSYGALQFEGLL